MLGLSNMSGEWLQTQQIAIEHSQDSEDGAVCNTSTNTYFKKESVLALGT